MGRYEALWGMYRVWNLVRLQCFVSIILPGGQEAGYDCRSELFGLAVDLVSGAVAGHAAGDGLNLGVVQWWRAVGVVPGRKCCQNGRIARAGFGERAPE